LGDIPRITYPAALRVNSPDTRFGLDDLQALLLSPAEPDYLILPKCDSSALVSLVGNLLREANKSTQVIALIESTKAIRALAETVSGQQARPPLSSALRIWLRTSVQKPLGSHYCG
jgi:(S)-citramalyl-CoA lyase